MALANLSIADIAENILSDIEAEIGQTIPRLAKMVFVILAYAIAGVWIILYKYSSDAYRQRFPQTASGIYLSYLGELVGLTRDVAIVWEGEAEIIATGNSGSIDADTQFLKTDTGKVFVVVTGVVIAPGTLTLSLIATEAGSESDLIVGDTLDIVSAIAGVEMSAIISAVTTPADDIEDLEDYRLRIIERYTARPQGGAAIDYVVWGKEAPNVSAIYPYSSTTPTEIDLYVEVDDQTDGIPTAGELTAVEAAVTYNPDTGVQDRKPLGVTVTAIAITRTEFDVELTTLNPDTPAIRAEISAALTALFLSKAPYIQGASISRVDTITYTEVVAIIYAVLQANSATVTSVSLEESATPVTIYPLGQGEKAKLGTLTYV
jgi:uncharacterized phage protein gp47/JayE